MIDPRIVRWRKINRWIGRLVVLAIVLNVVWFFWWRAIPMPRVSQLNAEIETAPVQLEIGEMDDFEFEWKNEKYWATPLYSYDLAGLVVSRNTYGSIIDPTNTGSQGRARDLCTVWGSTATSGVYRMMKFHNTNYTCWGSWGREGESAKKLFRGNELGNNHLISDSPTIRRKINSIDRGDQIRLRGYLVEYGRWNESGKKYTVRGSSTTRGDRGNGACETIFVQELEVLDKNFPLVNGLMSLARKFLGLLILLRIAVFFILSNAHRTVENERLNHIQK